MLVLPSWFQASGLPSIRLALTVAGPVPGLVDPDSRVALMIPNIRPTSMDLDSSLNIVDPSARPANPLCQAPYFRTPVASLPETHNLSVGQLVKDFPV